MTQSRYKSLLLEHQRALINMEFHSKFLFSAPVDSESAKIAATNFDFYNKRAMEIEKQILESGNLQRGDD